MSENGEQNPAALRRMSQRALKAQEIFRCFTKEKGWGDILYLEMFDGKYR